jgi:hypothetical protein
VTGETGETRGRTERASYDSELWEERLQGNNWAGIKGKPEKKPEKRLSVQAAPTGTAGRRSRTVMLASAATIAAADAIR